MSKFKVGDKVYSFLYGVGEVATIDRDNFCFTKFSDKYVGIHQSQLDLVEEQNPTFNLEQFKAGIPAITYYGKVAKFISDNSAMMDFEVEGSTLRTYSSGDAYIKGKWQPYFVCMKPDQEPLEQPVQESSEASLGSNRYEWFKQYLMSDLTIDSLENEIVDCKSSQEFDEIIDKYSRKISFNKP